MQKNGQEKKSTLFFRHKTFLGILIFVVIYVITLFIPLVSNYTQFPLYVVKCSGLPLVTNGGGSYITPDSATYSVGLINTGFYCTEQEAQAAGFRKSSTN